MPRFLSYRPDGGIYILDCDRDLPESEQVRWHHRDPLPSEVAAFEQDAGRFIVDRAEVSSGDSAALTGTQWRSNGPANNIRALLTFIRDVQGPGPDGRPLVYPADGSSDEKERFFAIFRQADLYEVAEAILERKALTEDERGN